MSLRHVEFEGARRMVAWQYDAISDAPLPGVFGGTSPPNNTDHVAIMMGAQGHFEVHMRWGTGARAGAGMVRWLFYPELISYYGDSDPTNQADLNSFVPVLAPNASVRLTDAQLGAAFSRTIVVPPMVYLPRRLVAPATPGMPEVGMELTRYRFELRRDVVPAGPPATYEQKASFESRLWGQEGMAFPANVPTQRSLSFRLGWEGVGANGASPFVDGDALTIIFRNGGR